MKAITIQNYGDSDALIYGEADNPEIQGRQVIIEVFAASVNHIDIMTASGKNKDKSPLEFPWIPGADFAGRIDFAPQQLEGFKRGDEVYGKLMRGGSYAEYLAADPDSLALMPSNLSFSEAASVPHVGLTAWEAVFEHGKIEPGQTVLVIGAAGAVGTFAVQFAKVAGGFIYAIDRGDNREFVESLGADVMIDYTTNDFTTIAKDVDLVLDFAGRDYPSKSYPLMKKGGRLISTAAQTDQNESEKYGVTAISMGVHPDFSDLSEITQLIESGKIKTDIAQIFPLREAKTAWDTYSHKIKPGKEYTHGKIILEIK
ncbi:MAG: NADP-dependent oxidoreductase [Rikenellaceae bacterium]|nr:NADP-dependent oxidoreductase [Rikenellaceae bacterium]